MSKSRRHHTNGTSREVVAPAPFGPTQFRALVEKSPDMLLRFDSKRRLIFANPTVERYLDVGADDIVGQRVDTGILKGRLGSEWLRGLDRAFATGEATSFETEVSTSHGDRVFEVRLVPEQDDVGQFDAVFAIAHDVTRARHQRRLLEESDNRWRRLVEYNPDAIVVLVDGRFVYGNRAASRMLGVPNPIELIGRSVLDFFSAEDFVDVEHRLRLLTKGIELEQGRYRLLRADGYEIEVEVFSVPVRYAGRVAVQSVLRDVSEQREYELRLIEARRRAEEIARLKSSIVTNLSHEIRTPLANVLGFNQVLRDHVDEEGLQMLEIIRTGIERLLATLTAVLELARLEADDRIIEPEEVNVVSMLRETAEEALPLAERSGIELHLILPDDPILAYVDPYAVNGIVWRLLGNAIKFTPAGSVTVRLECTGSDVVIAIQDTGIGISAEFLPRLFEEFEQESKGLDRNYEGVGLGLAIVKRLVELCDARITVESTKGEGSTFTVCFPNSVLETV